jgi:hypothetical protein
MIKDMKKIVFCFLSLFVLVTSIACNGTYYTMHIQETVDVYLDFKANCCAGSKITVIDVNSGASATFEQHAHGSNSSCKDNYIV